MFNLGFLNSGGIKLPLSLIIEIVQLFDAIKDEIVDSPKVQKELEDVINKIKEAIPVDFD